MENKENKQATPGQTNDQNITSESFFNSIKQLHRENTPAAEKELIQKLKKKQKKIDSSMASRKTRIVIKLGKYGCSGFAIGAIIGFVVGGKSNDKSN
ncbi:MAG: hypothetical protein FJ264_17030 [Planctomycetes bacterium]|nr:hypothetical protein [Planctomycetota bacterium]